jgi:hypothetical protein
MAAKSLFRILVVSLTVTTVHSNCTGRSSGDAGSTFLESSGALHLENRLADASIESGDLLFRL